MGIEERKYTSEEAMALDRQSQMTVLRARNVTFSSRSREAHLVELILKSNNYEEIEMARPKKNKEPVEDIQPEAPIDVPKKGKYTAKTDINLSFRKGDNVPEEVVLRWKEVGFNIDLMVE